MIYALFLIKLIEHLLLQIILFRYTDQISLVGPEMSTKKKNIMSTKISSMLVAANADTPLVIKPAISVIDYMHNVKFAARILAT